MFLVHKIVFLLNFIFAAALALAYMAPGTDPEAFWPFAFFGLAYPILLIINVFFIIYWIAFKKLRFILSLGLIIFGWGHVNNIFQISSADIEKTDASIRVFTFNTKRMGTFDNKASSYPLVLPIIDSLKPEIICFQEFLGYYKPNDNSQKKLNKLGLKYQHFKITTKGWDTADYGNIIASKYPILSKGEVPIITNGGNNCIYADIVKDGDTIRIYSLHLQSIGFQPQDYKFIQTLQDDTAAVDKSKNIISRLKNAFKMRASQAKLVRAHIDACPYKVIVCGDFNDTPSSFAYHKIKGKLKDAFKESGSGISRTYVGPFPSFRIDHILIDPAFDGFNYTTFSNLKSDHKMVMTDVMIR